MELLDRASFLRTLAEYAADARRGDGRLVLVPGESGMGKTALLEAFRAELRGACWLWGACDGLLTPRPLGPLFDVAAQLDGELADLCRDGALRRSTACAAACARARALPPGRTRARSSAPDRAR